MTDDQQPAPGAAERRRSTARSAAAKRVRGDFVAQIPKRFSEGFTERIDLIIRIVFMVVVAVGCCQTAAGSQMSGGPIGMTDSTQTAKDKMSTPGTPAIQKPMPATSP